MKSEKLYTKVVQKNSYAERMKISTIEESKKKIGKDTNKIDIYAIIINFFEK